MKKNSQITILILTILGSIMLYLYNLNQNSLYPIYDDLFSYISDSVSLKPKNYYSSEEEVQKLAASQYILLQKITNKFLLIQLNMMSDEDEALKEDYILLSNNMKKLKDLIQRLHYKSKKKHKKKFVKLYNSLTKINNPIMATVNCEICYEAPIDKIANEVPIIQKLLADIGLINESMNQEDLNALIKSQKILSQEVTKNLLIISYGYKVDFHRSLTIKALEKFNLNLQKMQNIITFSKNSLLKSKFAEIMLFCESNNQHIADAYYAYHFGYKRLEKTVLNDKFLSNRIEDLENILKAA